MKERLFKCENIKSFFCSTPPSVFCVVSLFTALQLNKNVPVSRNLGYNSQKEKT